MKKRILAFLSVLLLLVSIFPLSIFATDSSSDLVEKTDLSKTSIEYDFEKVFDGAFDVKDFMPSPTQTKIKLVAMTEYINELGQIELYLYVYNPAQRTYFERGTNKVAMSIEEDSALFNNYQKYELERIDTLYFSKSTASETNASLIKYKVNTTIPNGVNQRSYGISEIELQLKNGVMSYPICSKYIFTKQSNGTYEVMSESSDVIEIDKVGQTFYKVQTDDEDITDDIRTVYFAVDKKLVNKYGIMDSIKVDWHEVDLKPILLLDNQDIVNEFQSIVGVENIGDFKYSFGTDIRPGGLMIPFLNLGHYGTDFEYGFNISSFPSKFYEGVSMFNGAWIENSLWAEHYHDTSFDVDDGFKGGVFDKIIDKLYFVNYCEYGASLPGEDILKKADEWDRKLDGIYSSEISDDVRYYNVEFNVRQTDTIGKYEINTSYWDYIWNGFKYDTEHQGDIAFNRFVQFDKKDLQYSNEVLSSKWLIDSNDVTAFREFAAENDDCYIYFLRYSITETKQTVASVFGDNTVKSLYGEVKSLECNGSFVETTIINDFDIIQLGFDNLKGGYTIVPVSFSPIDSAVDVTHKVRNVPKEKFDWLSLIRTMIVIVLIAIAFVTLLIVTIIVLIIVSIFKKKEV